MSESMTLHARTKKRMSDLGLDPQKTLGQNFLVNDHVVNKIIEAVKGFDSTQLIEVGPGVGSLTELLLEMEKPLKLVEFDRNFAAYWRRRSLIVFEGDALRLDWGQFQLETGTTLVSNLPYQISTHIVVDRCLGPLQIENMVLMFQKEVAERIIARPRTSDYGTLSVLMQSCWDIQKVVDAAPGDFWPAPKVASQVLQFKRKKPQEVNHLELFLKFLKVAFSQRRKFLIKNLLSQPLNSQVHIEVLRQCFDELHFSQKARPEELSVIDFQKLFSKLGSLNGN